MNSLILASLLLPKLFFQDSWLYDNIACDKVPVKTEWAQEAFDRENEFARTWEDQGPELYETLFKRFPYPFSRKELTATLSVCPSQPSYSQPLVVTVARFLKSYMGEAPTKTPEAFVDLVFHELTHTWVNENLQNSELLNKYKDESRTVRNHLHLMAIQKYVYTASGRTDLLRITEEAYQRIGGDYLRSWLIVNQEGEEAFMLEFERGNL